MRRKLLEGREGESRKRATLRDRHKRPLRSHSRQERGMALLMPIMMGFGIGSRSDAAIPELRFAVCSTCLFCCTVGLEGRDFVYLAFTIQGATFKED
jgi:hypothetical protein